MAMAWFTNEVGKRIAINANHIAVAYEVTPEHDPYGKDPTVMVPAVRIEMTTGSHWTVLGELSEILKQIDVFQGTYTYTAYVGGTTVTDGSSVYLVLSSGEQIQLQAALPDVTPEAAAQQWTTWLNTQTGYRSFPATDGLIVVDPTEISHLRIWKEVFG